MFKLWLLFIWFSIDAAVILGIIECLNSPSTVLAYLGVVGAVLLGQLNFLWAKKVLKKWRKDNVSG